MPFQPEFQIDENLKDLPQDPAALMNHIQELQDSLTATQDPKVQVSLLGDIGVYLRTLGHLDEAEAYLLDALDLIAEHGLGIKQEVQQMIRLAHVLQWQKEFSASNEIFEQILEVCRQDEDANVYLAFALQHAGKNLFDQERFQEALSLFEEALEIRKSQRAHPELLRSTEMAIAVTQRKLNVN